MDIFNNELWENKSHIFQFLFINAIFLYSIYSLWQKERKRKKSHFLKFKIIGYQHALFQTGKKDPYQTHFNFYPVISIHETSEQIVLKNLCILKPEGHEASGYIDDDNNFLSRDIFASAYGFFLLACMSTIIVNSLLFVHTASQIIVNFIVPSTSFLVLVLIILSIYNNIKETGSNGIYSYDLLWPKRPENYDDLTEDYFEAIKNKELSTYEEAKAYYYHQNQHGKLYAYIAYGIAFAGIVLALLLITKKIKL